MDMMTLAHEPNRAGFESHVLPLRDTLYGRALRLCRDEDMAADLVQDTVIRAWRFWPSYRQGSNLSAWLRRILTNTFINECRRDTRKRSLHEALRGEEAGRSDARGSLLPQVDHGFGDEVHAALRDLPEDFRQVLMMVDVEGGSYREAADALGCPVGTVMSRLHRARRALKKSLSQYAEAHGYAC